LKDARRMRREAGTGEEREGREEKMG